MGAFKQAVDVNQHGEPYRRRFEQIGNEVPNVVAAIKSVAVAYAAFREDLADTGDDEDLAVADGGFDLTVTNAAQDFASLTDDQRAWIDQFFAGLGYTRSE